MLLRRRAVALPLVVLPLVVLREASALANEQWTKVDIGGKTAKLRVVKRPRPSLQLRYRSSRRVDGVGRHPCAPGAAQHTRSSRRVHLYTRRTTLRRP